MDVSASSGHRLNFVLLIRPRRGIVREYQCEVSPQSLVARRHLRVSLFNELREDSVMLFSTKTYRSIPFLISIDTSPNYLYTFVMMNVKSLFKGVNKRRRTVDTKAFYLYLVQNGSPLNLNNTIVAKHENPL